MLGVLSGVRICGSPLFWDSLRLGDSLRLVRLGSNLNYQHFSRISSRKRETRDSSNIVDRDPKRLRGNWG